MVGWAWRVPGRRRIWRASRGTGAGPAAMSALSRHDEDAWRAAGSIARRTRSVSAPGHGFGGSWLTPSRRWTIPTNLAPCVTRPAVHAAGTEGPGRTVVGRAGDQRRPGAVGPGDHGGNGPRRPRAGQRLDGEVGYGLPVGTRFVGTPRVGFSTSEYGQDYRVGYGLGVLDRESLTFELGVDAQRRTSPLLGCTSNGVLGRATVGW